MKKKDIDVCVDCPASLICFAYGRLIGEHKCMNCERVVHFLMVRPCGRQLVPSDLYFNLTCEECPAIAVGKVEKYTGRCPECQEEDKKRRRQAGKARRRVARARTRRKNA